MGSLYSSRTSLSFYLVFAWPSLGQNIFWVFNISLSGPELSKVFVYYPINVKFVSLSSGPELPKSFCLLSSKCKICFPPIIYHNVSIEQVAVHSTKYKQQILHLLDSKQKLLGILDEQVNNISIEHICMLVGSCNTKYKQQILHLLDSKQKLLKVLDQRG